MACKYSDEKFYPFKVLYKTTNDPAKKDELVKIMKETFDDVDNLIKQWDTTPLIISEKSELIMDAKGKDTYKNSRVTVSASAAETATLEAFLGGGTSIDVSMLKNDFVREIVSNTIMRISSYDANAHLEFIDVTDDSGIKVSKAINAIKLKLIRTIFDDSYVRESLNLENILWENVEVAGPIFENLIRNALNKNGNMTVAQRNAIAMLANFDKLLAENCPFIKVTPRYENAPYSCAEDKYIFEGASIAHLDGWTDGDVISAMDQTSALAKVILNNIPIAINNGFDPYLCVTQQGFFAAALGFRQWVVEGCKGLSGDDKYLRDKIEKDIFSQNPEVISKWLTKYAEVLKKQPVAKNAAEYADNERVFTSATAELQAINHFIFNNKAMDPKLMEVFMKQLFSYIPLNYTGYAYDMEKKRFMPVSLKAKAVNQQMSAIKNSIVSSIFLERTVNINKPVENKNSIIYNRGKFVISISNNTIKISTDNNTHSLDITLDNNKTISKIDNILFNHDDYFNLLQEVCQITVDRVRFEQIVSDMFLNAEAANNFLQETLGNVIAPCVVYGVCKQDIPTSLYKTFKAGSRSNSNFITTFDKKVYDKLRPFAKLQTQCFGENTKSVVRSVDGKTNLPVYGLVNLGSRFTEVSKWLSTDVKTRELPIFDINGNPTFDADGKPKTNKIKYKNPYENNWITAADQGKLRIYSHSTLRSDISGFDTTTKPSGYTVAAVLKASIECDFLEQLYDDTVTTIGFQTSTHADKTTHFIHQINKLANLQGADTTIRTVLKDACSGDKKMLDLIRHTAYSNRRKRTDAVWRNILYDYAKAFNAYDVLFNNNIKTPCKIDTFIQWLVDNNLNFNKIQAQFKAAKIDFIPEVHFTAKNGFNVSLYNAVKMYVEGPATSSLNIDSDASNNFNVSAAFAKHYEYQRTQFIKDLYKSNITFNPELLTDENWIDTKMNAVIIAKDAKNNACNEFTDFENTTLILHPVLEAYFAASMLFGGEINDTLLGNVFAHPSKIDNPKVWGKTSWMEHRDEVDSSYIEKDWSQRLAAQVKRSVIIGATMHLQMQGLDNGVADTIHVACMKDMPGFVRNVLGKEKEVDSGDGSGLSFSLHRRLENNSLVDGAGGVDRKTIGHGMNPFYCDPQLLKWAVFDITNIRRQAAWGSECSLEQLYKKMGNFKSFSEVGANITGQDLINIYKELVAKGKNIFVKDPAFGTYYKLVINADGTALNKIPVDKNGMVVDGASPELVFEATTKINNWYEVDQYFGGAWAMKAKENTLVFDEMQLDVMETLATKNQILKDCYVAFAVNNSGIKVGGSNSNSIERWYDDAKLDTFSMSTKYYGIQMDAEHHITEDTDVSEMTQMISALSENGFTKYLVDEIYSDIGECIKQSLHDIFSAFGADGRLIPEEGDKILSKTLGKIFMRSMETKDTIGLAQALIAAAINSGNALNINDIPISAPSINSVFISSIVSHINKTGIKRKWAGFAGVQTPAYNFMQYYNIGGTPGLYRHFADTVIAKARKEYEIKAVDETFKATYPTVENYLINNWKNNSSYIKTNGEKITLGNISQNPSLGVYNENELLNYNVATCRYIGEQVNLENLQRLSLPEAIARGLYGANDSDYTEVINKNDPRINYEDTITWFERTDIPGEYIAHNIKIRTADDYYNITNAIKNGNFVIGYKNLVAPRNLGSPEVRFSGEIINIDGIISTIEYRQDDLDSVKAARYLNKGFIDINTPEGKLVETVFNAELENNPYHRDYINSQKENEEEFNKRMKQLRKKLIEKAVQRDLATLSHGGDVLIDGHFVKVIHAAVIPGESLCGRVGMKSFGLMGTVDMNFIRSAEDMKNAVLISGQKFSKELQPSYYIGKDPAMTRIAYDISAVTSYGKKILFKVVDTNNDNEELNELLSVQDTAGNYLITNNDTHSYDIEDGTIYYNNREIFRGIKSNVDFKKIRLGDGSYDLIILKTTDPRLGMRDLKKCINSSVIDNVRYYFDNYNTHNKNLISCIDGDLQEALLNALHARGSLNNRFTTNLNDVEDEYYKKFIDAEAITRFEAFNMARHYIGTRIPAQAMQSFMHLKMVAFTDSEVNELFLNPMKMYDDGSDYDIDKGYLLGYGIKNGKVVVNSNLYLKCKVTYDPVTDQKTPWSFEEIMGIDVEPTNTVEIVLNEDEADTVIEIDTWRDATRLDILNHILNEVTNPELQGKTVYVKSFDPAINIFEYLQCAKTHLETSLSTADMDMAIKNKTLYKLFQVLDNPINFALASTSVDTVSEGPKNYAKSCAAADSKNHLDYDNAAAVAKMQKINMEGRAVIGIGAVSLKSFFGATAFYNNYITTLEDFVLNNDFSDSTNFNEFMLMLSRLFLDDPLNADNNRGNIKYKTVYANLNFDHLIEILEDKGYMFPPDFVYSTLMPDGVIPHFTNPLTKQDIDFQYVGDTDADLINVADFVKMLQFISMENDAAFGESALLTLATDNAKELALSILNATAGMADIYTYLMSIGKDFDSIGNIMTSSTFNFIASLMEADPFMGNIKPLRLSAALNMYIKGFSHNNDLNNSLYAVIKQFAKEFKFKDKDFESWTKFEDIETFLNNADITDLKTLYSMTRDARAFKMYRSTDDDDYDFLYFDESFFGDNIFDDEFGYDSDDLINKNYNIDITKCNNLLAYLQRLIRIKNYKKEHSEGTNTQTLHDLNMLLNQILPGVEAQQILGRAAGINKGMKTSTTDMLNWQRSIEMFYNKKLGDDTKFSMQQYIDNNVYADEIDAKLGTTSQTNPLYVLMHVPHYEQMLRTWSATVKSLKLKSFAYRTTETIFDNFGIVTPLIAKVTQDTIGEAMIATALKKSNIQIQLPSGTQRYINGELKTCSNANRMLTFDNIDDFATFKHLFEGPIFTALKRFTQNGLTDAMVFSAKRVNNNICTYLKFNIPMNEIDSSVNLQYAFKQIMDGFKEIKDVVISSDDFGQLTYGDAFYLYNMIVNKDKPGADSMTLLFQSLISAGMNNNTILSKVYTELNKFDQGFANISIDDLIKDIKNNVKIINGDLDNDESNDCINNPDFTFHLFKTLGRFELADSVNVNRMQTIQCSEGIRCLFRGPLKDTIKNISGLETKDDYFVFYNKDQNIFENDPNLQQLYDNNPEYYKNANAFVYGGRIYINVDNADFGDAMHEWMHLVLARLKWNPNKDVYYQLMDKIREACADNKDAGINSLKKQYSYLHDTDLYEEILVHLCAGYARDIVFLQPDSTLFREFIEITTGENVSNMTPFKVVNTMMEKIFDIVKKQHKNDSQDLNFVETTMFNLSDALQDANTQYLPKEDGDKNEINKAEYDKLVSKYSNQIIALRDHLLMAKGEDKSNLKWNCK